MPMTIRHKLLEKIKGLSWIYSDIPTLKSANQQALHDYRIQVNRRISMMLAALIIFLAIPYTIIRFDTIFGAAPVHNLFESYQVNMRFIFPGIVLSSVLYLFFGRLLSTGTVSCPTWLKEMCSQIFITLLFALFILNSVNAQLYNGELAYSGAAAFGIGTLYVLRLRFSLFLYFGLGGVGLLGIFEVQTDPSLARINSANLAVYLITAWLWSRYMFRHRLMARSELLQLAEQDQKVESELTLASNIQRQLLPPGNLRFHNFEMSAAWRPVGIVSGDFYDYIHFDDDERIGIFVCDAVGHGVPAALVCSIVKNALISSSHGREDPVEFLNEINRQTVNLIGENYFTAFYCILNRVTGTIHYARGGHTYPWLVRGQEVIKLDSGGYVLGVYPNPAIEPGQMQLQAGDRLIVYSDGFLEEKDMSGTFYEDYLQMSKYRSLTRSGPMSAPGLMSQLTAFKQKAPFLDDTTLVCVNVAGV